MKEIEREIYDLGRHAPYILPPSLRIRLEKRKAWCYDPEYNITYNTKERTYGERYIEEVT